MIKVHTKNKHRKSARGVVILFALFFLMILALLGSALIRLVPSEFFSVGRERTDTAAHYAVTAAMKQTSMWITAVQSPGSNSGPSGATAYADIGDHWSADGSAVFGGLTFPKKDFDPFSLPASDPNFYSGVTVADCISKLPINLQSYWPGGQPDRSLAMLGLADSKNLTGGDFNGLKTNAGSWPCLVSKNPVKVGPVEVYTFVIPDGDYREILKLGATISSRRCYLLTTVAFIDGLPFLRARAVMQETTYAKYAWYIDKWGTNAAGQPYQIFVNGADDVIADGPFHSNTAPVINVAATYWDSISTTNPKKHAFQGALTFGSKTATGVTVNNSYNFDNNVAWVGGNWGGTDVNRRPFDNSGNPIASAAGGNRYDRIIQGGKPNLKKITDVNLPADLTALQTAAFGSNLVTGLASATAVNDPQKTGATVSATYNLPAVVDASGNVVQAAQNNIPIKTDVGIFVNPKSSGAEVAGGVAIKGDMRSAVMEVVDANGNIVTDTGALTGTTASNQPGNPAFRVMTNEAVGMDTKSSVPKVTYTYQTTFYSAGYTGTPYASGYRGRTYSAGYTGTTYSSGYTGTTYSSGYRNPYSSGYRNPYSSGYRGAYASGYNGTTYASGYRNAYSSGYRNAYSSGSTPYSARIGTFYASGRQPYPGPGHYVSGAGPSDPPTWIGDPYSSGYVGGYPSGSVAYSAGSGTFYSGSSGTFYAAGTRTFYAGNAGTFYSASVGTFYAASVGTFYAAGVPRFYSAGVPTFYSAGFGRFYAAGSGGPYASGYSGAYVASYVYEPKPFYPVDWVVETSVYATTIPATISRTGSAWADGVGVKGAEATGARFPDLNAVNVYVHTSNSSAGTIVPVGGIPVTTGKVLVFKQNRTDSTRIDVFVLDKPASAAATTPALNGAIYGTGNLDSLRGVNLGRHTIGVDLAATGGANGTAARTGGARVSIGDNLWQAGTAQGTKPLDALNGLGLVAGRVVIRTDDTKFGQTAGNQMQIYASIIAGSTTNNNGLDVSNPNYDNNDGALMFAEHTGKYASGGNPIYQIFGGLIESTIRPTSWVDPNDGLVAGWNPQNIFDAQLAANPPPFFPTANSLQPMSFVQERLH